MVRDIRKEGLDSVGEEEILSTGQVIKLTGISEGAIRKYEAKGLISVEQTGEHISNNRRLWHKDDVRQLGRIKTLQAYGFALDEIRLIFDDDEDVTDMLLDKLDALRQEEARLHRLILFAKFVTATDDDVVDGLMYGSLGMEDLADIVRDAPAWEKGQERIAGLSDEDLAQMRHDVEPILDGMLEATVMVGFEGIEDLADRFAAWWRGDVLAQPECGFLELWASFEDGSLAATQVEKAGGKDACATVQAILFYVFMKRLMLSIQDDILLIAEHAESDAVRALPEAQEVAMRIVRELGIEWVSDADAVRIAPHVLLFAFGILEDRYLLDLLDPTRAIRLTPQALERTIQTLQLLTSD